MALTGTFLVSGLWPPFGSAVRYLQAWCSYYNYRGEITSGFRSFQEQAALYALGRTQNEILNRVAKHGAGDAVTDAPPGESAHNYGLAIDISGPDRAQIIELARWIGFGLVSWDPEHIEWPNWRLLIRR